MTRSPAAPAGFEILASDPSGFVAGDPADRGRLERAGLLGALAWGRLPFTPAASGRGGAARIEADGLRMRVKPMRRGGLIAPLFRDRHVGTGRLLANLRVPAEALRRGVPTARPIALAAVPGPPGLYRAWLAVEEIGGARDLAGALRSTVRPDAAALRGAMRVVRRMHDAGIEHRDLNLGNLLVREGPDGSEAFVIDLDRARIHRGPVPPRLRERALARLERSTLKLLGTDAPALAALWYDAYAADDPELRARLRSARRRGRWLLGLRRIGRSGRPSA